MNDERSRPILTPFSNRYDLVSNVEVVTVSDDVAQMGNDLWQALARQFGEYFMGLVEGRHYSFKPIQSIPADTVAVPEDNHQKPNALLIKHD